MLLVGRLALAPILIYSTIMIYLLTRTLRQFSWYPMIRIRKITTEQIEFDIKDLLVSLKVHMYMFRAIAESRQYRYGLDSANAQAATE